jgi:hypothetical protein
MVVVLSRCSLYLGDFRFWFFCHIDCSEVSGASLIKQLFDPSLLASSSGVLEGNEGQDPAIETWTGDMP